MFGICCAMYVDKSYLYAVFDSGTGDRSSVKVVLSVRRNQPYLRSAVVLC